MTTASTNPLIKVWYVVDSAGEARVAVLHKDMSAVENATYARLDAHVCAFLKALLCMCGVCACARLCVGV